MKLQLRQASDTRCSRPCTNRRRWRRQSERQNRRGCAEQAVEGTAAMVTVLSARMWTRVWRATSGAGSVSLALPRAVFSPDMTVWVALYDPPPFMAVDLGSMQRLADDPYTDSRYVVRCMLSLSSRACRRPQGVVVDHLVPARRSTWPSPGVISVSRTTTRATTTPVRAAAQRGAVDPPS